MLGEVARKFRKHYPDVKISVAVPDELLIVPMDAILIEQVMTNLLENAVRHGKNTTHIALSVHQNGENAVFAVQDNGGGIPPKLLPALFSGTLRHSDFLYVTPLSAHTAAQCTHKIRTAVRNSSSACR